VNAIPGRTDTGIRLYSTLSKRKEPLTTGPNGEVRIYACGPTVYSRIHIGNARPFVVFSVLARFLERRGLRAVFAANITDINDKIYDAARREEIPSTELAEKYARAYVDDTDRLGLGRPTYEPKVTELVPEIVALIQDLVDAGLAYPADGDVYYRVQRFAAYGELSRRKLDEMQSGEEHSAGKESPLDFALWKGRKPDEDAYWDSPWGPGRPGWHIECSAMAEQLLGPEFEIHGGGIDLVFPHHENEIAQSVGAGRPFAKIWMHNEMLELAGEKMAKSVGNIQPLQQVMDEWPRDTVIAYFLTSHYRSKLPFSHERLEEAGKRCERIRNGLRALDSAIAAPGEGIDASLTAALSEGRREFFAQLDDDFNTPAAFAAIDGILRVTNQMVEGDRPAAGQLREAKSVLLSLLDVFALTTLDAPDEVSEDVLALARERDAARAAKDWAKSDRLRDAIQARGFEVRDSAEGSQVYPAQ
jgi:cysteinyl-tRNA synthetase